MLEFSTLDERLKSFCHHEVFPQVSRPLFTSRPILTKTLEALLATKAIQRIVTHVAIRWPVEIFLSPLEYNNNTSHQNPSRFCTDAGGRIPLPFYSLSCKTRDKTARTDFNAINSLTKVQSTQLNSVRVQGGRGRQSVSEADLRASDSCSVRAEWTLTWCSPSSRICCKEIKAKLNSNLATASCHKARQRKPSTPPHPHHHQTSNPGGGGERW